MLAAAAPAHTSGTPQSWRLCRQWKSAARRPPWRLCCWPQPRQRACRQHLQTRPCAVGTVLVAAQRLSKKIAAPRVYRFGASQLAVTVCASRGSRLAGLHPGQRSCTGLGRQCAFTDLLLPHRTVLFAVMAASACSPSQAWPRALAQPDRVRKQAVPLACQNLKCLARARKAMRTDTRTHIMLSFSEMPTARKTRKCAAKQARHAVPGNLHHFSWESTRAT